MATKQKFTNETIFVETEITDAVADSNNPPTTKAVVDYIAEHGGVTPTGTITITENDTYDVTNYASAEVNVSGGSSDFSTAKMTVILTPDETIPQEATTYFKLQAGICLGRQIVSGQTVDNITNGRQELITLTPNQNTTVEFTIPLYKNRCSLLDDWCFLFPSADEYSLTWEDVTITGDAEYTPEYNVLNITGDFTITVPYHYGSIQ